MNAAEQETVRGELLEFRVLGQECWGRAMIKPGPGVRAVTVMGKMLGCEIGDTVEIEGSWTSHPKYGRQFQAKNVRVVLPNSTTGVVAWLASKLPQISVRRAAALVEKFGVEGLWQKLAARDEAALCAIDGITPPRAAEIFEAYEKHVADRDRIVRFKQWGLTDSQVARVIEEWGDKAEEKLAENPYSLIEHVDGFGWERADQVALRMGLRRDEPARYRAGLVHAMGIAVQAGHCFTPVGMLIRVASQKICQVSDEAGMRRAVDELVSAGKFVRREQHLYLPRIAEAEGVLAKCFAWRARAARGNAA